MNGRRTRGSGSRPTIRRAWAAWLGLVATGVLTACNAILGIDEAVLEPPTGQGGQGAGGGVPGCTNASECDDANPCTVDECDLEARRCVRTNVPNGPAPDELQAPGDCRNVVCSAGDVISQADNADLPVDGNECTDDLCTAGVPSNPDRTDGATCDQNDGVVCYQGNCVECYVNQHCTPPDTCGDAGTPFECSCSPDACDSISCGWAEDLKCLTGWLDCDDQTTNGDETDVDCGGPTVLNGGTCDVRCADGRHCSVPSDCGSNECTCGRCGPDGCVGGAGGTGGTGGSGGTGGAGGTGGGGG